MSILKYTVNAYEIKIKGSKPTRNFENYDYIL